MKKILAVLLTCFLAGMMLAMPSQPAVAQVTPVPANEVVVYYFSAPWCHACQSFSPTFDRWEAKYSKPGVKFVKINCDQRPDLARKYHITAMPTVIVAKRLCGTQEYIKGTFIGGGRESEVAALLN